MKSFYIFIFAAMFASAYVQASEEFDPALAQDAELARLQSQLNGTDSAVKYMDDEDMDFGSTDEVDAFTSVPNAEIAPTIPMIQKKSETNNPPPPAPDNHQNMPIMQRPEPSVEKKIESVPGKKLPKNATLTDTLQNQSKETLPTIPLPDVAGTWVDKLAGSVPLPGAGKSEAAADATEVPGLTDSNDQANAGLRTMIDSSRQSGQRSNASVFEISGIMLRMSLSQAEKAMMIRGFKRISQKLEIPNFIKWRNEEKCRINGVLGHERTVNCVIEIAKKENHQYVESAKFSKFATKEEIEIKLTSNFTGNKIYHITYKSLSGNIVGSGVKAAYLRNIKVYDFWKKVNQKYGSPDNKDEVTWGLGGNKPYMKAATGFLLLEDPMLSELDYTRMSREDQRFMNTDLYSF